MIPDEVKCPLCGSLAVKQENSNTNGELAVCDDGGCFDPKVVTYRCTEDTSHLFYISE